MPCGRPDPSAPTSNVEDPPGSRAALAFFEKSVRPTLAEHCYRCHAARVVTDDCLRSITLICDRYSIPSARERLHPN